LMTFSNCGLCSSGRVIVLRRDFSPDKSCKSFLGQSSALDRKLSNAAFALPSSGAAAMRIRRRPFFTPANSVFEAPGTAFISSLILPPSSRKQLFMSLRREFAREFAQGTGDCGAGVCEKSVFRLIAEKRFGSVFFVKIIKHCFLIDLFII